MSSLVSPAIFRFVVLGSYDVGKTTFLNSLGAKEPVRTATDASAVGQDAKAERIASFSTNRGHQEVIFSFNELLPSFFEDFDHENGRTLPASFEDADGAIILFSYTDINSRARIRAWLKFFQLNFPAVHLVVGGSKCLEAMKVKGIPSPTFAGYEGEVINYDSNAVDLPVNSVERVMLPLARSLLNDDLVKMLLPVPLAAQVAILAPTTTSQALLKPIVLYRGESVTLGRIDVHTGVFDTLDQKQLVASISREHIQATLMLDGTVSVIRFGSRNIALDDGSTTQNRRVLRVKQDASVLVPNGRLHLSDASDAITYELKTLASHIDGVDRQSVHLSFEGLLDKMQKDYKNEIENLSSKVIKLIDYLKAALAENDDPSIASDDDELSLAAGEMNRLELVQSISNEEDHDDYYYGNTQAY
jgi:GTPase SAR1 family protein